MSPKAQADQEVYISDLATIINREIGTIRKWEREGKLPKKLLPRRGERGWRCWTHSQVHGKGGIIEWMKKNDMRPGRMLSDPANADAHVRALRRPKYLNSNLINIALKMVNEKASPDAVVAELFPQTRYTSKENLEAALRRYFRQQGWEFPNRDKSHGKTPKKKSAHNKTRK